MWFLAFALYMVKKSHGCPKFTLAGPPGVGPGTLAPLSFRFSVRVASEFVKSPVLYLFRIPTVWNLTELRARGTDNLPSCS